MTNYCVRKINPSDKLTDTQTKQYADIPYHDQFSYINGYRYFDSFSVEPAYHFVHNKSSTEFTAGTEKFH
ncbi:MAG: hypothetical protein IJ410_08595 [Oscillospiraceae bacterium]|nr:hypothetical protein [Oscillospiraceae bacterium]